MPNKTLLNSTSVNINGKQWTFRTPPPPITQRSVISSHPRLFLTQANLPGIRVKLSDPVYANDIKTLKSKADSGDPAANALLYQLEGNSSRGTVAKNWLLGGSYSQVLGFGLASKWVEPILVFDWVMPLLTSGEKTTIFNLLKANFGYDHRTATPKPISDYWTLYWNDRWSRQPELHYPILALAIAGDGIDDVWAQEVLDLVYSESNLVIGPYGATHGRGFLDILATLSLESGGGEQAGDWEKTLGGNYYYFFLHAFLPMGAWETATGQPMWVNSPYFQKLPSYWAYEKSRSPTKLGMAMPEMLTGIYRNIDPDAAALARWQVNKWGRSQNQLVYRLILGDLRVTPKSPHDLGFPTAKYIPGSDLFVSSRSWDDNALTLNAYSKYLDTSRYEPASGIFAIFRGDEPLATPGQPYKQQRTAGVYSGVWFYDPNNWSYDGGNNQGTTFSGTTYWAFGPGRAYDAYTAASTPGYFYGGPDNIVINGTYRGISTEYSSSLNATTVNKARQTIVHILDNNRDYIVVYNYTDVSANLKRAWSMRLSVPPNIQANGYSIPGMTTTVVSPTNHTLEWVGGLNDELRSPSPEKFWYGNNRNGNTPGYSADPIKAKINGIGNLFVKPQNPTNQLEFLVVMDVSNQAPVAVSRISDREVHFGGWQVSFSPDGNFNVVWRRRNPSPFGHNPPSFTSKFKNTVTFNGNSSHEVLKKNSLGFLSDFPCFPIDRSSGYLFCGCRKWEQ